jgi:hypothetical protein
MSVKVTFLGTREHVFTLDALDKVRAWLVNDEGLIVEVPPDAALRTIEQENRR